MTDSVIQPRVTFPRVASDLHPLADGSRVARSIALKPLHVDSTDLSIAKEIIEIHRSMPPQSAATGEWQWINQKKRQSYLAALQAGDAATLAEKLAEMFRNEVTYGIITSHFEMLHSPDDNKQLESALLLDLDTWKEFTEKVDQKLSFLDMPRVGHPYGLLEGDVLISADTPRHDYFALKIRRLSQELGKSRPTILEIGGGYGGLPLQILRRMDQVCYIDCDLPESLFVTYYFLRKATNKKIVWYQEKGGGSRDSADVLLVPAHNLESIQPPVDILINCNSLSEMAGETISHYFKQIHRLRPSFFLHQNSNFLLFPNSERHIEVLASEFPIDRSLYQEVYRAMAPWQGAGGRYREFLYRLVRP